MDEYRCGHGGAWIKEYIFQANGHRVYEILNWANKFVANFIFCRATTRNFEFELGAVWQVIYIAMTSRL